MTAFLEFFFGASLDPGMWVTIIICTRLIKNKTFISALFSTIVYVGVWGIIRFVLLEITPNEFWLIMSIITTFFWGLIVGIFWNRKRKKSDSLEFGGDKRNEEVAKWGKSIPLTSPQQEAIWELYKSMKAEIVPSEDPLEKLSEKDKEYIKEICASGFRPAEFGNCDPLRLAVWRNLKEKGYNPDHAAILIGMMFNMVGRKDL